MEWVKRAIALKVAGYLNLIKVLKIFFTDNNFEAEYTVQINNSLFEHCSQCWRIWKLRGIDFFPFQPLMFFMLLKIVSGRFKNLVKHNFSL